MPGPAFGVHIRAKWEMRLVWWGIVHDWIKEIELDSVDGGSQQGCLNRTEHCENKMKEWLVKPAASPQVSQVRCRRRAGRPWLAQGFTVLPL